MQPELAAPQRPGKATDPPVHPQARSLLADGVTSPHPACRAPRLPTPWSALWASLYLFFSFPTKKPSTFFDQRSRKATAKSRQINFIDISIFTATRYPPSHGRDDPHYLQTDRPLHYNHPAPRQSSSPPSAQTLEHDPEVAVLFFFAVCYDLKKKKKVSQRDPK